MRINKLHLQNFRCFEELTVEFHPQMNILIGDNESGKTSILKALRILLGEYLMCVNAANRQIQLKYPEFDLEKDIRIEKKEKNWERIFPMVLTGEVIIFDMPISLVSDEILFYAAASFIEKEGREGAVKQVNSSPYNFGLDHFVSSKISEALKNENKYLPLIAYYPTDRLWQSEKIDSKDSTARNNTRFLGYESALRVEDEFTPIHLRKVANRFRTVLMNEIQHQYTNRDYRDSELELIRNIIKESIPNCTHLIFDLTIGEFVLYFENEISLPFSLLSDGYRNMVAMMLDIAFRCFTLNPNLGVEAGLKTEGIVLIDEIDLHLHPKWQKEIIGNLKKAFPKIQFIITTHSPLILSTADKGEVLNLSNIIDNVLKSNKSSYKGWKLDFILEDVMKFLNEEEDVNPIIDKLDEAFDNKDFDLYDAALAELAEVVHPNDSLVNVYTLKKARMRLKP